MSLSRSLITLSRTHFQHKSPCLRLGNTRRWMATQHNTHNKTSNASAGMYTAAVFIGMLGISYAAVPLYRLFCASTGYSGTVQTDKSKFSPDRLVPTQVPRRIRITFESNTSDALPWTFKPELRDIHVVPGETALTFYKAKSHAKEDVVGIATYNVTPYRAGNYFNKIQCFCFEEQRLAPGEDIDMPVFFFIDPDFLDDPYMKDVSTITLGYTLFNAKQAPHLAPVNNTSSQPTTTS
ncbi:cytochrome c oxidase assembly protein CtaG/Cox11-domain-containing protein [Halteromyces radiatus]|uniref:cytochrome c oxidase assembly protein CtaG/Cox11-domain-containing protein n=1 Tax=Halteromyces radiatus TaxID=101107 RepID=UPI00221EABFC|nr:cytochrome c oxidase assembly protein CtaG/Cox11-domain-containing protein [Halteromyces radiatus]KAI8089265.1 cytochrome c oxidase assembly protein CtaG/Cox11-domain-containing protein [Halteromyces radiatus]